MKADAKLKKVVGLIQKLRSGSNAEGMTTREVAKELGVSKATAQEVIRDAIEAGLCKHAGRKTVYGIDGRANSAPVFRFLAK